ncbi:MAG: putative type restriction endonuclease [Acidobacteriota bacterium]|jgi:predicted transport protein|nr:putative type restriction endonuclease [Acidobacteriota bacterium]
MALADATLTLLGKAEELKGSPAANEANTKALLIDPLLSAVGWQMADLAQVRGEFKVFDGTFLDYALLIDGSPRLFVEAKAVGESLDSKQFISQTVNYANNEGVLWCVLTNGLTYRVYKTNEPVSMEQKLLFEVSLADAKDGRAAEVADSLKRISPAAVVSGELDSWGEQVFADARVRDAVSALAVHPPGALIDLIEHQVGQPKLSADQLTASIGRVLAGSHSQVKGPKVGGTSGPLGKPLVKAPTSPKQAFTIEHHTVGKPTLIIELFEQLDAFAMNLGPDVSRRERKFYVGYFAGKRSFFTAELQKARIWVYLNLDPESDVPWVEGSMRDVRTVGHYGMGDTEFNLHDPAQLDPLKTLVQTAYERTR